MDGNDTDVDWSNELEEHTHVLTQRLIELEEPIPVLAQRFF